MANAHSRKTHCPRGHAYEGDNLVLMKVRKDGVDTGKRKRQCRRCKIEDSQRRRDEAKEKGHPD